MWKSSRLALILVILLAACAQTSQRGDETLPGQKLRVVTTTTILGDVVRVVGGEHIELSILLPVGADPHSFEPTPQDVARVAQADVVFINGAGLEEFLEPMLESAGKDISIVSASEGIPLRGTQEMDSHTSEEGQGGDSDEAGVDPHVWTDPNNVSIWVKNIADVLGKLDPANARDFSANAARYQDALHELDRWVQEQVAGIPPEDRELVTDHAIFGYFADRYGFRQVGAVIPGYSTLAEPSARELAALEDAINHLGVKAIFVGNAINPSLAQRVAEDTGTKLVILYTGSLSPSDGPAANYIDYIKYNVNAIVDGL